MFMPTPTKDDRWGKWCPRTWGNFKRAALAIGMTLRQNGDSEGCLSFDPANDALAKFAIKIAGVRPKRRVSSEAVSRLLAAGRTSRFIRTGTAQEHTLEALKAIGRPQVAPDHRESILDTKEPFYSVPATRAGVTQ